MIVYLIVNTLNDRPYVGKTTRTLTLRWQEHIRDARSNRKKGGLYTDLRAFGPEAFTITELATTNRAARLNQIERKFIRLYRATECGYNTDVAAHGGKPKRRSAYSYIQTAEHRQRISDRVRQIHAQRKAQAVAA